MNLEFFLEIPLSHLKLPSNIQHEFSDENQHTAHRDFILSLFCGG